MKDDLSKCFKCKTADAKRVMSDPVITKGRFKGFCIPCYESYFKETK